MPLLDLTRRDSELLIRPLVSLCSEVIPDMHGEIKAVLDSSISKVTVDLSSASMVDSSGIGLLIAINNTLAKRGNKLTVNGFSPEIGDLFRIMRLDKHFQFQ